MTKPTKPKPPVHGGVVEMDAMDVHEWDAGQRTPQASDANLAALVKQSAGAPAAAVADKPGAPGRPQFVRTTQTSPRIPGQPAPAPPRDRPRPVPAALKDTVPELPPAAAADAAAPQPLAVFDDFSERTLIRRSNAAASPASAPMPSAAPMPGAAPMPSGRPMPGVAPMPSGESTFSGAHEASYRPAAFSAVPTQSPFPSTPYAAESTGSFGGSSHEGAPLRYPLAIPESTAPPRRVVEPRLVDDQPAPRTALPRKLWWIGGAISALAVVLVLVVVSGGASDAPAARGSADATVAAAGSAPATSKAAPAASKAAPTSASSTSTASTGAASRAADAAPATAPSRVAGTAATTANVAPAHAGNAAPAAGKAIAAGNSAPTAAKVAPTSGKAGAKVAAVPATPPSKSLTRPTRGAGRTTASDRAVPAFAPAASPKPARRVAAVRPNRRPAKKPKIVVEDAEPAHGPETPGLVAQAEEDPAIARARGAYISGNDKLFAGDTDGAIESYREALVLYPGYVGGYRGLGLAYAQRGDHKQALDAFKSYVTAAPTAKDVSLIKKRIVHLQRKPGRPAL